MNHSSLFLRMEALGQDFPWLALEAVVGTLERNKRPVTGNDYWRKQHAGRHLSHAERHLSDMYRGDRSENHAAHYATRSLMAAELMLARDAEVKK